MRRHEHHFGVKWGSDDKGVSLDFLKIPKGKWSVSNTYAILSAIQEWGGARRPSEFGLCEPENDLAYIVAYHAVKSDMTAYEQEENMKESERASKVKR